jgi:hypothetical protein
MNYKKLVMSNNRRKAVDYEVERIATHCIYGLDAWTS